MKLDQFDTKAISDLDGPKVNFGIAKNLDKVFQALTTYVYKNPIWSVIAELSQNALDSHIEAGKKDIPFDVHLPTNYEPYFSIRDYGVSMSEEFMLNGYTIAFNSTKANSNEGNGAWGIGRLTALALQDTYNVTCFKDGKKREYLVFKQDNLPQINKLSEEDSQEKDGVLVSVNVGADDVYDFKCNACEIYSFHPTRPNFNYVIDIRKYDYLIEEDKWSILQGSHNGSRILMGCYSYPIEIKSLGEIDNKARSFLDKGVFIKVGMGDVSVNLSRDGLFYDDKTKTKIKERLNDIVTSYENRLKKEVDGISSKLKAFLKISQTYQSFGNNLSLDLDWNGTKLIDSNSYEQKIKFQFDPLTLKTESLVSSYSRYRRTHIPRFNEINLSSGLHFDKHKIIKLYHNDVRKPSVKWRFTDKISNLYSEWHIVFTFKTDADWDKFLLDNQLEKDDFIAISSLPEVKIEADEEEVERIKNDKHSPKNNHFTFNGKLKTRYLKWSDSWDIIDVDSLEDMEDTEIPYVTLYRFQPSSDIEKYINILSVLGYTGKIIGIKDPYFEKDKTSEKWLTIEKFAAKLAENHVLDEEKIKKIFIRDNFKSSGVNKLLDTKLCEIEEVDGIGADFILSSFKETTDDKFDIISSLRTEFDKRIIEIRSETDKSINKIIRQLNKKYPLHNKFEYCYDEKEKQRILKHYIKLENLAASLKQEEQEVTS